MAGAFQSNAFQSNAFQVIVVFNESLTDGSKTGDAPIARLTISVLVTDGTKAGDTSIGKLLLSFSQIDGTKLGGTDSMILVHNLSVAEGVKSGEATGTKLTLGELVWNGLTIGDMPISAVTLGDLSLLILFRALRRDIFMATDFDIGETIVCSIAVTNSAGVAHDPVDSMKILITNHDSGATIVASTDMTHDGAADSGLYHYDFQTVGLPQGVYDIQFIGDDGTRISIEKDYINLS